MCGNLCFFFVTIVTEKSLKNHQSKRIVEKCKSDELLPGKDKQLEENSKLDQQSVTDIVFALLSVIRSSV